jgi:hypothetical protein
MITLAERLRKLEHDLRLIRHGERQAIPWPELCAVVEAAMKLDGTSPRWVTLNEAIAALACRMDEEGL